MQTYTHVVMTALLNRKLKGAYPLSRADTPAVKQPIPPLNSAGLLLGSFAPDAPLTLLAIGCIVLDWQKRRRSAGKIEAEVAQSLTGHLFSHGFFHDWRVKLAHNLFHAPLLLLAYGWLGVQAWQRGHGWGAVLFWFAAACGLHTLIDIPLHADDGPLILFPLDWSTRVHSPVSYWDPKHYGRQFAIFEHLLLLGMLGTLVLNWWRPQGITKG